MTTSGRPRRVLLCVSGGIAAYKAPELVRAYVAAGIEVRVITTAAARAFVTELSLATVSKHPVRSDLLDAAEEGSVGHIELADWPDAVVVAPATANIMAKAATGIADDLVSVCLLATRAPILWAPAMNTNMWRHPATAANLATLLARGARFVGPDRGELACGWVGEGRMIDPAEIVDATVALLRRPNSPWAGKRVLVSAGPTRAYLDPVRFLTNASTGAMGFAIAAEAAVHGAEVTLVAGPVERGTPAGVRRIDVETADQTLAAMAEVLAAGPCALVAMVAAVADVATSVDRRGKLDKAELLTALDGHPWRPGVDVLRSLIERYGVGSRFLGFAAQTYEGDPAGLAEAMRVAGVRKLRGKGAHGFFVNRVGVAETGFASATNAGWLLLDRGRAREPELLASGTPIEKAVLARWLLDRLADAGWAAEDR